MEEEPWITPDDMKGVAEKLPPNPSKIDRLVAVLKVALAKSERERRDIKPAAATPTIPRRKRSIGPCFHQEKTLSPPKLQQNSGQENFLLPLIIRLPVREESTQIAKNNKRVVPKRPRCSFYGSDYDYGDDDAEKARARKRTASVHADNDSCYVDDDVAKDRLVKGPISVESKKSKGSRRCIHDPENGRAKQGMKMKMKGPPTPPELPEQFRRRIEELKGTEPVLVIQKQLYQTDLSKVHCRLSIPPRQIENPDFLTQGEKAFLHKRVEAGKNIAKLPVLLIEPSCKKEEPLTRLALTEWIITKKKDDWKKEKVEFTYNLCQGWNELVKRNKLGVGMIVQLWAFRVNEELHFALVRVIESTNSVQVEDDDGGCGCGCGCGCGGASSSRGTAIAIAGHCGSDASVSSLTETKVVHISSSSSSQD